jgi:prevent-host-death family protein
MNTLYRAGKTELARNTRQIIRAAQRGQTVVIEHHGQPEVAILDIADYHILRALAYYHAHPPKIESDGGLREDMVVIQPSLQAKYNLVLAYYLAGEISLSRTAELLDMPWLDLRTRFLRLDVPLRSSPADLDEVQEDIVNAEAMKHWEAWLAKSEELSAKILKERGGEYIDVERVLEESRAELEGRHDYLFND